MLRSVLACYGEGVRGWANAFGYSTMALRARLKSLPALTTIRRDRACMANAIQSADVTLAARRLAPKLRLQSVPGATRYLASSRSLPIEPNSVCGAGPWTLWLGPAEWLIYALEGSASSLAPNDGSWDQSGHCVSVEITSALTLLELSGPGAVELLAGDCGLDLEGGAIAPEHCAQTAFHHVPLMLHRPGAGDLWRLFVDRSLSRFFCDSLSSLNEIRTLRSR